ncbi:exopolysaccharide biosynthesis protein [Phyllobacterium phragmitis]|uniref:Exopolysaccharide biosynthesis protein n=1 Tax=Phyllobacterium phragmitis TaxID=2670329 RepID=A0A2S9IPT5_9HYPH|nr:sugar transferase [Phyllobacterium phragmitis]PRD42546.1 exopolysaccharide biosynthesis protein [Phyllobacterium phragmitis]
MKPATKLASFPFLRQSKKTEKLPVGGVLKRSFDVIGAAAGLFLLSPLFILVAILVKLSDGGSAFYGHRRIGRDGNPFYCLKFRTMVQDGDAVLTAHFASNPEARAEWLASRKLQKDPRVTNVGAVLRKLSLDELPQLVNVLRGEMSLVGPRPVVKDEIDLYGSAAIYYFKSRPGLTGVWQISGRNDVSYDDRIAFDRHYVENWSFQKDIVIILKTIPAVCASRGSY